MADNLERAAGNLRGISALTITRLRWLKHARCVACGAQARTLMGGTFYCAVCTEHKDVMRKGQHLIDMARL